MVAVGSIVRLADEIAAAELRNDPFGASYMGVSGYDDAAPDLSPDARQGWRDCLVNVLIRSEHLEADDADSRMLLAAERDNVMRARPGRLARAGVQRDHGPVRRAIQDAVGGPHVGH